MTSMLLVLPPLAQAEGAESHAQLTPMLVLDRTPHPGTFASLGLGVEHVR